MPASEFTPMLLSQLRAYARNTDGVTIVKATQFEALYQCGSLEIAYAAQKKFQQACNVTVGYGAPTQVRFTPQ